LIRRGERPQANFTILSNELLQDERLSYRARGVLVEILSHPDNWRVSRELLAKRGKEGRNAVGTAINELIECGYATREKRQGKNGKWETEVVVYDYRLATDDRESTMFTDDRETHATGDRETHATGDRETHATGDRFPVANTKTVSNKNCLQQDSPLPPSLPLGASSVLVIPDENPAPGQSPGPESADGFERWWEMYPKKKEKKACLAYWRRMPAADREAALAAIPKHLAFWEMEGTDPQYIVYPIRWLKNGRWDDDLTPAAPARRGNSLSDLDAALASVKADLTGLHERDALNSPVLELPTETGDTP
jgi:hypothetical protein